MVFNGTVVLSIFFGVWLVLLTVWFYRIYRHYNNLTHGVSGIGLQDTLESLMTSVRQVKKSATQTEDQVRFLTLDGKRHIQKIGIVRFNPFSDTGGSQSFTMALLDNEECGIVMTSLYARTGNRWYVKEIRQGQGVSMELSKEEQAAIRAAHKIES